MSEKYIFFLNDYAQREIIYSSEIDEFKNDPDNSQYPLLMKLLQGEQILNKDRWELASELLLANNEKKHQELIFKLNPLVSQFDEFLQIKEMAISLEDFLIQKMEEQEKLKLMDKDDDSVDSIISDLTLDFSDFHFPSGSNYSKAHGILAYCMNIGWCLDCAEISINTISEEERKEMSFFDALDSVLLLARSDGIW